MLINGVEVDVRAIVNEHGSEKITAVQELRRLTGITLAESKKIIEDEINRPQHESITIFKKSNSVPGVLDIDNTHMLIAFHNGLIGKKTIYSYNDIIAYELLEDGSTLMKGGLGHAIAGGVLFGGAGAVVGSVIGKKNNIVCTNLSIRITVNDPIHPIFFINFITSKTKKDSFTYKAQYEAAQSCIAMFQYIENFVKNNNNKTKEIVKEPSNESFKIKRFCSNCGERLEENARFCSYCGAKVNTDAPQIHLNKEYENKNQANIRDIEDEDNEELAEYKKLLDMGLISKENYEEQKKRILKQ